MSNLAIGVYPLNRDLKTELASNVPCFVRGTDLILDTSDLDQYEEKELAHTLKVNVAVIRGLNYIHIY